ncbi:YafY family transcriptional regulator [Paenibacillus rhizovicinus]|uniref:YafY family transcriptional regulator n=1 Tax=Paenibacillus rhizovicinus TaxID=2704463 RepID=A0A6C0NUJ4_9BACL|nr:YafY family protein [Paenibacillus rhizovicinus]QHW29781.1 YafY family transcriptional regulator [Paenibacillus rhizovicinus]
MKLDRLLAITMTLLNQSRVSATALAERFEVSLRTIYRDMDAINQSGIPIVSYPGADGGYEIMSSYRIDKQILTLDDFSTIYSALRGITTATDQSEDHELLDKIGAMIPGISGTASSDISRIDLDFKPTPNDKQKFAPLHDAIKQMHVVQFAYLDNKGQESERAVEPMGLFLKGYVWYLYGYCLLRSEMRNFRLSRILRLQMLPETFARRNYTLQDVEKQFMDRADFSKVKVKLHFDSSARTRVLDEFGFDQIHNHEDGTLSVHAHYSSVERAMQTVLSYGSQVTVTEPVEFIESLRKQIQWMAEKYGV